MKFFALLLCLMSFSALACPKLEGHFQKCNASDAGSFFQKVKRIAQERMDGEMVYAITYGDTPLTERTEFYPADGISHSVESGSRLAKNVRTFTATCVGDKLELKITREFITPISRSVLSEEFATLSLKRGKLTNHLYYKNPARSGAAIIICD